MNILDSGTGVGSLGASSAGGTRLPSSLGAAWLVALLARAAPSIPMQ